MLKFLYILLVFFTPLFSLAQTSFLKTAAIKFDKALVDKDTIVLKQLLHKDATYGHSNGWVETKADIINDLVSGKLIYKKIVNKDEQWIVTDDVATLRSTSHVSYVLDSKPGELQLHVVKVWLKTNKGWQLLIRQSTKI